MVVSSLGRVGQQAKESFWDQKKAFFTLGKMP